jgi:hypothetical protein
MKVTLYFNSVTRGGIYSGDGSSASLLAFASSSRAISSINARCLARPLAFKDPGACRPVFFRVSLNVVQMEVLQVRITHRIGGFVTLSPPRFIPQTSGEPGVVNVLEPASIGIGSALLYPAADFQKFLNR